MQDWVHRVNIPNIPCKASQWSGSDFLRFHFYTKRANTTERSGNAYAKIYGLPNEEIFTGWLSLGFGLGIELDNLSSLLKSESGFKE